MPKESSLTCRLPGGPDIVRSGEVADMVASATAEAGGRVLASRLYNMTQDAGMKDMLPFLIARDTMHQQQWLAVIEELGGWTLDLGALARRARGLLGAREGRAAWAEARPRPGQADERHPD